MIFRSGTDLISLLISLFLLRRPLQKAQRRVVSNRIWMKFGRIDGVGFLIRRLEIVTSYQKSDSVNPAKFHPDPIWNDTTLIISRWGHYVISSRKVLPPGEWIRSVCRAPVQQRPPVPDLYSTVHSYLFWFWSDCAIPFVAIHTHCLITHKCKDEFTYLTQINVNE